MFFLASHADVLRGSCGAGTRGEPLRTSAWEAMFFPVKVPIEFNLIQQTKTYKLQMSTDKTMSIHKSTKFIFISNVVTWTLNYI